MQVNISDPSLESAIHMLIEHHKAKGKAITNKEAVAMLLRAGVKASSRPTTRQGLVTPTPNDVQAFCEQNNLKPYTKGLGYVMNLRQSCENWKEEVKTLYKPKDEGRTMQLKP